MVSNRVLFDILKVILTFFVAFVALGLIIVFVVMPSVIRGETVEVPNVRGMSLWEARNKLTRVGLSFELQGRRYDPSVPADYVVLQSPPASVNIRQDRPVKLTLSLGAESVEVPDLTYKRLSDIEPILQSTGLALGSVVHVHDDEAPLEGTILAQNPLPKSAGTRGQAIHLLVSDGVRPKLLLMPNLRGQELSEVRKQLRRAGLAVDVSYQADTRLPAGQVVEHRPAPEQYVRVGQTVQLVVSGASRMANQKRRSVSVRHQVSEGETTKHVRIEIEDALGTRRIIDDNYPPGTLISKPAIITGSAVLRVYEDDMQQPIREVPL